MFLLQATLAADRADNSILILAYVFATFYINYIVGTGGDGANTVNIFTCASMLAASCGAKVSKVVSHFLLPNWCTNMFDLLMMG